MGNYLRWSVRRTLPALLLHDFLKQNKSPGLRCLGLLLSEWGHSLFSVSLQKSVVLLPVFHLLTLILGIPPVICAPGLLDIDFQLLL